MLESDFLDRTALEAGDDNFDHDLAATQGHPKSSSNTKKKLPIGVAESNKLGASNAGLRLLDACYDDIAYARFLLRSKNPRDLQIRHKVNWKDQQSGNSIIHCLVCSDLVEPVKLLLVHDANPNITNKHEETPLHWCAKMNSMKCAKALIEAKAQVDALDNCGSSPLHYAVMMENLEIIVLLLDNGANALITDADNNTAMELAAEGKSTASKAILVIFQRHYERLKIPFPRTIRLKMAQFNPINPNSASNDNSNNVESATVKQQATVTKAAPSPKPVSAEPVMSKSKSKPHITEAHSSVPSPVTRPSSPPPKTIYDQLASGEMKSNDHPPRPQKAHAAQPGTTMVTSQSQTGFSRPPSAATVRSEPASNASSRPMSATRSPGSSSPMRGTLTDSKSQTPVFSVRHVERPLTPDAMRAIPSQTEVVTVRHAHEQDVQGSIIRPSSANKSPNKPRGKHTDQTQTLKTSEVISEDQEFQNQIAAISKAFEQQQTVTGTGSSKIINPAGTTGAKPVEVIPVVRENIAELVFPPADMIPFLPEVSSRLGDYNPAHLDVMIEVEHCCDCHLHNDQSLRHDPKKYVQVANAILYSLIKVVASSKLAVRLYALRSKTMSEKRVGALEVTVAIRLSFPEIEPMETSNIAATPSGRQKRPSFLVASPTAAKTAANREKDKKEKAPIREKENMRPQKWASHKIFSKLHSKSWPSVSNIEQKTVAFLETTLKDAYRDRNIVLASHANMDYVPNPQDDEENMSEYKKTVLKQEEIKAIQNSYDQWMERMRIPPKIERDPLDLDFPTGLFEAEADKKKPGVSGSSLLHQFIPATQDPSTGVASIIVAPQQHPPGPYLDVKLAQICSKEEFEKLTLQHFLVFDNRFQDNVDEEEEEEIGNGLTAPVIDNVVVLQEAAAAASPQPTS